jgi:hypothetical protein
MLSDLQRKELQKRKGRMKLHYRTRYTKGSVCMYPLKNPGRDSQK